MNWLYKVVRHGHVVAETEKQKWQKCEL